MLKNLKNISDIEIQYQIHKSQIINYTKNLYQYINMNNINNPQFNPYTLYTSPINSIINYENLNQNKRNFFLINDMPYISNNMHINQNCQNFLQYPYFFIEDFFQLNESNKYSTQIFNLIGNKRRREESITNNGIDKKSEDLEEKDKFIKEEKTDNLSDSKDSSINENKSKNENDINLNESMKRINEKTKEKKYISQKEVKKNNSRNINMYK